MKRHLVHILKILIPLCAILSGWFLPAHSQPLVFPLVSEKTPHFWLDAGFFNQDDQVRIEFYYSIALKELNFSSPADDSLASFTLTLSLQDQSGASVFTDTHTRKARFNKSALTDETKGVVDQFVLSLPAGVYRLQARLTDMNAEKISLLTGQVSVPSFPKELSVSEPQVAISIRTDAAGSTFKKGNITIIPNPSRRYRYHNAMLYLYYELYNLEPTEADSAAKLSVIYSITDQAGDTLMLMPRQKIDRSGRFSARVAGLDVRGLEAGAHTITVAVFDSLTGRSAVSAKQFWIHQPALAVQLLPMSPEDVKRYRDQIKYIATHDELKLFDELDPEGKTNFLLNFWRGKDESPETPENEYMQNMFSRIDYANKNFKGRENGLNSDMGRVFVVYGKPDDIEQYTWETGRKSYAIWRYFTAGGQHSFVFVDRNHEGIYYLVHSTVEEEIKNYNWEATEVKREYY
ncbi:GWxTD domain-containing protein [bacterium]|nr:GWxTD domain-containing protein [bacterium]